jgi:hypothetical protein
MSSETQPSLLLLFLSFPSSSLSTLVSFVLFLFSFVHSYQEAAEWNSHAGRGNGHNTNPFIFEGHASGGEGPRSDFGGGGGGMGGGGGGGGRAVAAGGLNLDDDDDDDDIFGDDGFAAGRAAGAPGRRPGAASGGRVRFGCGGCGGCGGCRCSCVEVAVMIVGCSVTLVISFYLVDNTHTFTHSHSHVHDTVWCVYVWFVVVEFFNVLFVGGG